MEQCKKAFYCVQSKIFSRPLIAVVIISSSAVHSTGFFVNDLVEKSVESMNQVMEHLYAGSSKQRVASTAIHIDLITHKYQMLILLNLFT